MYSRIYDEQLLLEPSYPANKPSEGDYETRRNMRRENSWNGLGQHSYTEHLQHAPPGLGTNAGSTQYLFRRTNSTYCRPCYEGLSNNVSIRLMKTSLISWTPATADYVNHRIETPTSKTHPAALKYTTARSTRRELKIFRKGVRVDTPDFYSYAIES